MLFEVIVVCNTIMSQLQWEYFLLGLVEIEVKYWRHLKGTSLSEYYVLGENEDGVLTFQFKSDCDLPEKIKEECYRLFDEIKVQSDYQSKRQG
jgi:hypothetical protein